VRDGRWAYTICIYRPARQGGGIVIESLHSNPVTLDVELDLLKDRMRRGEIGTIDVIAHVPPFTRYRITTEPDEDA